MIPRLNTGKGVSGAVRYVLGQGRDPKTGQIKAPDPNAASRVAWVSGTGFSFAIEDQADVELARKVMEFDAVHQASKTRRCEQDCVHLTLGWRPGQTPSRFEMETAARDALKALGMGNAKAVFAAHNDEDYSHVHIVASKINPATGRAYDLAASWRTLSTWGMDYEREHGGIICTRREDMNDLRKAIADRDPDAVLEAMTKAHSTFTDKQLHRALEKEIIGPGRGAARLEAERDLANFYGRVLAMPQLVELIEDATTKANTSVEPWMKEAGGFDALGDDNKRSAEKSYEIWATEKNPEAARRHGLGSYVTYVQEQWAKTNQEQQAADRPTGQRFTTKAVLDTETQVLLAAKTLYSTFTHGITDQARAKAVAGKNLTDEQTAAFIHCTLPGGLALIDGQAGTGKSYTIAAVREAYEASGCRVVGLAPTNAVVDDMRADGFRHAATMHSELFALNNGRRSWDAKTVVVLDESAMIDTKMMSMITAHAVAAGAKLILAGDDRQLSSIDRGGMFGALKDRHGAAEISQVKRQHKNDERRASEMMAEGNFSDALKIYDQKGAINWTRTQGEARAALVEKWTQDTAAAPDKTRFVFAYTNQDVAGLNAALRNVKKERGELGRDHELDTAHGRLAFAKGDRIQFTANDKKAGIVNGGAGVVEAITGGELRVMLDGRDKKSITIDTSSFDGLRHGYAGTIYKGQGRTLDQTYLYHSEHWRSAASYVALTRHREKTEMFVARNTSRDLNQLARQMARVDEKRAASMFQIKGQTAEQQRQTHDTTRLLLPLELLALIAPAATKGKDQRAEDTARKVERGLMKPARYDELQPPSPNTAKSDAETPEQLSRAIIAGEMFLEAAARLTASKVENFDRDAADAEWLDQAKAAEIKGDAEAQQEQDENDTTPPLSPPDLIALVERGPKQTAQYDELLPPSANTAKSDAETPEQLSRAILAGEVLLEAAAHLTETKAANAEQGQDENNTPSPLSSPDLQAIGERGPKQTDHYDELLPPSANTAKSDAETAEQLSHAIFAGEVFLEAAARLTEPKVENFDRDAADAEWLGQVDAAGIAKKDAAEIVADDAGAAVADEPIIVKGYSADEGEFNPIDTPADTGPGGEESDGDDAADIDAAPEPHSAAKSADRVATGILGAFSRVAETLGGLLFGSAMGGPKLTRQQMRDAAKARGNVETKHAQSYAAEEGAKAAEHDDRLHTDKTARQETDLRLAAILGINPTAEASLDADSQAAERERKRGLSL